MDILTSVSVIDAIAVQVEAMVNLPKKFFLDEMTRGWAEPNRLANEYIEKPSAVRAVPET